MIETDHLSIDVRVRSKVKGVEIADCLDEGKVAVVSLLFDVSKEFERNRDVTVGFQECIPANPGYRPQFFSQCNNVTSDGDVCNRYPYGNYPKCFNMDRTLCNPSKYITLY